MGAEAAIPVIDLFAGPGGLGEGFAALGRPEGEPRFRIALSIEKDPIAHQTLELRAFFRQFPQGEAPRQYYDHLRGKLTRTELFDAWPAAAKAARAEAWQAELGKMELADLRQRIRATLKGANPWVLIGGPPCQAYSKAGRSRNKNKMGYVPEDDQQQYLYVEYLQIIADHRPPVFVMENVKGLLSATLKDQRIFDRILNDLYYPADALARERPSVPPQSHDRYRIYSVVSQGMFGDGELVNFVVRAEKHGVPQARHRIILLGIREDLRRAFPGLLPLSPVVTVMSVLQGLPPLRSGLSNGQDAAESWLAFLHTALARRWLRGATRVAGPAVRDLITETIRNLVPPAEDRGGEYIPAEITCSYAPEWFLDRRLGGVCNHATRTHMPRDLHRYLYAACFAQIHGKSPRLWDFPKDLLPKHVNVPKALQGGYFADRFRVQLSNHPATTVTSHIAKDGHYYIHPDPTQCRALTVREAARLQTFPDNYFFCGGRTEQYRQVGNAVPPLLARQIARIVWNVLR